MTTWRIERGDCIEVMAAMEQHSVAAVVTDPPYGIGFMGHEWDSFNPARTAARRESGGGVPISYDETRPGHHRFQDWCQAWGEQALRVLKPGGHLVCFGGTRAYHRMVCGLEDAGFEIRDQLAWMFGSGFPKNRDLGDGWGTALKPGYEPILLARAPFKGSVTGLHEQTGLGGVNVDACRLPVAEGTSLDGGRVSSTAPGLDRPWKHDQNAPDEPRARSGRAVEKAELLGRWPSNITLDDDAAVLLDEQSGDVGGSGPPSGPAMAQMGARGIYNPANGLRVDPPFYGDSGGASRFFYVAKASREERNRGLGNGSADRNSHPTVKPIVLMQWLVRLVTPTGGTVLDPFAGSGTTGIACQREGFDFIGIEREADYVEIARARIVGDAPLFNQEAAP